MDDSTSVQDRSCICRGLEFLHRYAGIKRLFFINGPRCEFAQLRPECPTFLAFLDAWRTTFRTFAMVGEQLVLYAQ